MDKKEVIDRFERIEAHLKRRLSNYKEVIPVKWWKEISLLEVYWEWMDYLVKQKLKGKGDILQKWQRFLRERNTDHVADLLIGFFEAKRRYGRDQERWEDQWSWFALCKQYCQKWGWHNDEDLLHVFFSSYSWAERRIYNKVEAGKVLADTSKSLLDVMKAAKDDMLKKEMKKKEKEEEKKRMEEEKQRRKEERARKAELRKKEEEEKKRKREEEKQRKAEEKLKKEEEKQKKKEMVQNKWKSNNTMSKEIEIVSRELEENLGDDKDDVDPNYPKWENWWRDAVQPWSESSWYLETWEQKTDKPKKKRKPKKDDDWQLSFDFWDE